MITVQPQLSKTAFMAKKRRPTPEEIRRRQEKSEYDKQYDELLDQKEQFESLANSKEFKMSKAAKTALAGGAVVTAGLLGSMATGWGAKISIEGFEKLAKTSAMQSLKKHLKASNAYVKDMFATAKKKFVESDAYKMPANWIKKNYNKFGETSFGKPIVKFLNTLGRGIKSVYTKVKNGIKHVIDKIKGVKKETYEKAAVNTTAAAGGISSGVLAIKEKAGED